MMAEVMRRLQSYGSGIGLTNKSRR